MDGEGENLKVVSEFCNNPPLLDNNLPLSNTVIS